jgi:SNF family Na+-dependent transporter
MQSAEIITACIQSVILNVTKCFNSLARYGVVSYLVTVCILRFYTVIGDWS